MRQTEPNQVQNGDRSHSDINHPVFAEEKFTSDGLMLVGVGYPNQPHGLVGSRAARACDAARGHADVGVEFRADNVGHLYDRWLTDCSMFFEHLGLHAELTHLDVVGVGNHAPKEVVR